MANDIKKKRATYEVNYDDIEAKGESGEKKTFAHTLNKLLVERGIDQEQFASDCDISEGTISNCRKGHGNPTLEIIIRMANYLGVDCHYLITGVKASERSISSALGLSGKSIDTIKKMNPNQKKMLDLVLAEGFENTLDFLSLAYDAVNYTKATEYESGTWYDPDLPEFNGEGFILSTKDTVKMILDKAVQSSSMVYDSIVGYKWTIEQRRYFENEIRKNKNAIRKSRALIKQMTEEEGKDGKH